jgi:Protein of unknown function (DUF2656)
MRFLLSHNHNIPTTLAPALSVDEFVAIFRTHLAPHLPMGYGVNPIDHPHWRGEVIAEADPEVVGTALAAGLCAARSQILGHPITYQILALGGLKTTPATSDAPTALQSGEWGVDVVETLDAEAFLATLGWEKLVAGRSSEELFKITA